MQEVFEFCRNALPLRPKRPERLFFCLFPDIETSIDVRRFGEQFVCANDLRGRLLELGRLHISLQHVGDYKYLRTKHIYAARQAGKAVSMHPFDVALHSITSFDRPLSFNGGPQKRPLVLLGKGDALSELHNNLGAAMEKNGLRAAKRFTPHDVALRPRTDCRSDNQADSLFGKRIRAHP